MYRNGSLRNKDMKTSFLIVNYKHTSTLLIYCPCLYCFCDSMWSFLVEVNLCRFNPTILFIPVTSHGPDFRQMSCFFVLNEKVRGDCLPC